MRVSSMRGLLAAVQRVGESTAVEGCSQIWTKEGMPGVCCTTFIHFSCKIFNRHPSWKLFFRARFGENTNKRKIGFLKRVATPWSMLGAK